ncbi:hypothetical protein [Geodermatophilus sp. TF02-6]|uniref:hypothetical protein n=1 Tax=Geodermatophilus sp. TF02-6 TaxID=2250575 RepID=UPI0011BE9FA4|nr:hypothetical protein [Geodermatophilus sp. TF02-6]
MVFVPFGTAAVLGVAGAERTVGSVRTGGAEARSGPAVFGIEAFGVPAPAGTSGAAELVESCAVPATDPPVAVSSSAVLAEGAAEAFGVSFCASTPETASSVGWTVGGAGTADDGAGAVGAESLADSASVTAAGEESASGVDSAVLAVVASATTGSSAPVPGISVLDAPDGGLSTVSAWAEPLTRTSTAQAVNRKRTQSSARTSHSRPPRSGDVSATHVPRREARSDAVLLTTLTLRVGCRRSGTLASSPTVVGVRGEINPID